MTCAERAHSDKSARKFRMKIETLLSAYEATTFRAHVPGIGRLELRVGVPSRELDRLLDAARARSWAFVTAFNPRLRKLDPQENAERHSELVRRVANRGWVWYEGEGVPDQPCWDPETSALILGIAKDDALALGREFGQLAIVSGVAGGAPKLLLCAPD